MKPGGRLVYGTCSVLPIENEDQVASFLDRHPDFEPLPATEVLGPPFGTTLDVAPHTQATDGFFGAILQRR